MSAFDTRSFHIVLLSLIIPLTILEGVKAKDDPEVEHLVEITAPLSDGAYFNLADNHSFSVYWSTGGPYTKFILLRVFEWDGQTRGQMYVAPEKIVGMSGSGTATISMQLPEGQYLAESEIWFRIEHDDDSVYEEKLNTSAPRVFHVHDDSDH